MVADWLSCSVSGSPVLLPLCRSAPAALYLGSCCLPCERWCAPALVSPAAAIAYGLEKVGDNKARDVLITDLYNGAFSVIFLGVDGGIDFVWRFGQPDWNCEVDQKVLPFVRRSCCRRLDLARPVGDERQ